MAGFVAIGLVVAAAWYGYVLPEACREAIEEWERDGGGASAGLRPAYSC